MAYPRNDIARDLGKNLPLEMNGLDLSLIRRQTELAAPKAAAGGKAPGATKDAGSKPSEGGEKGKRKKHREEHPKKGKGGDAGGASDATNPEAGGSASKPSAPKAAAPKPAAAK